ncbi:hypothetical protein [Lactococcus garvieae]|uniref:hypothetical protein n=1 Tax=Lactococcus garvieae TaxID=1363 RepID=UPI0009BD6973|nr:hypothetical protein [Lactococcus garvieae]
MIKISLTSLLTYSAKVSRSAKIKFVRETKTNGPYNPAIDHWKQLRDAIKRMHENNLPVESLRDLLEVVSDKKIKTYSRAIKEYIRFVNKNDVKYFSVGKAHWTHSDDLLVSSSPELGLIINGDRYYVKIYYKKKAKDTKVTSRNINSILTLMQVAKKDFEIEPNAKFAVLNLQNGNLMVANSLNPEDLLELEMEADDFINMWNKV